MTATLSHWIGFTLIILTLLGIDLYRFYRHPHAIGLKEALITSAGWIFLAFLFNGWIYITFGSQPALEFLTGYLVEESLSIDNLFIFLLLFSHFKVPENAKHQVLFYGVLGAIVMRGLLIWGGITLIHHFEWIFIVFGLFLIFTGIRLFFASPEKEDDQHNKIYEWLKKYIPFTDQTKGEEFFVKIQGKWMATPLFALLVCIEITDLIFALDSVPAILGITTNPFIVYTSNIFAILGLRALFFALQGIMKRFYLLHYALSFILVFIGLKMTFINFIHVPTWITLSVLVGILSITVLASILIPQKDKSIDVN